MEWYFLAYKQIGNYMGRSSRQELNMFLAIHILIAGLVFGLGGKSILGIYTILSFLPFLALLVRRTHDTNHSSLLLFLGFIPFVSLLLLLYLAFKDSDHKINNHGIDPTSKLNIDKIEKPILKTE